MQLFAVNQLASLCKVDRETIRRWRSRGLNGVKLESTEPQIKKGHPIYFDAQSVKVFMSANPKHMTSELEKALAAKTAEEDNLVGFRLETPCKAEINPLANKRYLCNLLRSRRSELKKELKEIDLTLSQLGEK